MSNIVKIYEVKTLGYPQLEKELKNIESMFKSITDAKKTLNSIEFDKNDAAKFAEQQLQLNKLKIESLELTVARQKLTAEMKAEQAIRQANIAAEKANIPVIQAEAGSLTDLIAKRKQLKELIGAGNSNTKAFIPFDGLNTYDQAIAKLKQLETEIQRLQGLQKTQSTAAKVNIVAEAGSLNDLIEKRKRYQAIANNANENTTTYGKAIGEVVRLEAEIKRLQEVQKTQSASARGAVINEVGGLNDLISKRKELINLIGSKANSSRDNIQFNGQSFTRPEAIQQVADMDRNIARLKGQFQQTESFGQRMTQSISNGFANMRGQLAQLTLTYLGWFAAFQQAGKFIEENIKLSDTFADLQIRIHGTKDEVTTLFEELKKIDTRTSLASLVDIANIVAKKGVAKEEIAGLTAEFDKLNVVLGKEVGDPATSAASIIKLITIFNDDKHVTKERVAEIGTELFKLTTTGVATGEFLINFAERVGAVRGITGLTLPNILGMGAALQQLGQRTEVAGTAAVQLTTKLFTNVPKFAKAAQMSVEDFRNMLAKNPFDALVAVAEGLKNIDGDAIHSNFEEIVSAFGEVGVTGVRIKAVLGDIATNGAFVSQRMKQAAVNSVDYANQTAALELKQHTLAATIERVKKVFEELATNRGVQITFAAIAAVVLVVVSSLGFLLPIVATYAVIWGIANASMITARVSALLLNAQLTIQYAALVIASTFQRAYAVSLAYMTGATTAATTATTLLNVAMRLLPIGAVIALIAFLAAGCTAVAGKVGILTEAMRRKAAAEQATIEITDLANKSIAAQIAQMDTYASIITSTIASIDTQRDALAKLTEMNSKFGVVVLGNADSLNVFRAVLKEVKGDMIAFAQSQAAQQLTTEKYNDYLKVIKQRQELERIGADPANQIKLKTGIAVKIPNANENDYFGLGVLATDIYSASTFKKKVDELKKQEADKFQIYTDFIETAKGYQLKAEEKKPYNPGTTSEDAKTPKSVVQLQALIKDIDKEYDTLKEGDPKLKVLEKQREVFQARLDALNGKEVKIPKLKAYRGARLTGQDKDMLAEIDAQTRNLQAIEDTAFTNLQINHRATAQEELDHIEKLRVIDEGGLQKKINYLNSIGKLNAKQKEDLATFHKQMAEIELKSLNDSQKIKDEEFSRLQNNLKKGLDQNISGINLSTTVSSSDESLSNTDRAQIKLDNDKKILALQEKYNEDIDDLEKKLNQKSKDNALQGAKTKEQIIQDSVLIMNSRFKDVANAADTIAAEFQTSAYEQIIKILESGGSATKIAREIDKVQKELAKNLLINQIDEQKQELDLYKKGIGEKLKSEKDYQEALAKLKESESKLTTLNLNKQLTAFQKFTQALKEFRDTFKSGVFNIPTYSNDAEGDAQKQADAIKEAQGTISEAFKGAEENYFRQQSDRIDAERDLQNERLDREKELVKARAQSQAELDSIDNQYAAKKKELDRKAGEDKKKLALKQLAIDYALSVVKAIAQYGLPLALIPIAASTALYFVQKAGIQSQKFAYGGEVPTRGGRFGGRPHSQGGTDFRFKGNEYNAEVDELAVIRTRNASPTDKYSITGTQMEIASKLNQLGGGIEFRSGAVLGRKFDTGGILGNRYPAPIYNYTGNDISDYILEIRNLAVEQSNRIDRLEVYQVTTTVTNAQKKQAKQSQIGVLS